MRRARIEKRVQVPVDVATQDVTCDWCGTVATQSEPKRGRFDVMDDDNRMQGLEWGKDADLRGWFSMARSDGDPRANPVGGHKDMCPGCAKTRGLSGGQT